MLICYLKLKRNNYIATGNTNYAAVGIKQSEHETLEASNELNS